MKNVVTVILGGGQGMRLYPLTKYRAKPSVPIAGKFRLIDIPMSNCIHSELEEVFILTQFNSISLNRHIPETYQFGSLSNRSVRVLAAQQTYENTDWYQGTADAVRQNLPYMVGSGNEPELVLILAGDHLYRMDYRQMIEYHLQNKADITVGVIPVYREQAGDLGILKAESDGRITHFVEKPQTDAELAELSIDATTWGARISDIAEKPFLASMGIYVFNKKTLVEKLEDSSNVDFGKHILPKGIRQGAIYGYPFDGYWEDIGSIKSFYQANLGLLDTLPAFNFYDESTPVYTYRYHLPSTKVNQSSIYACMLAEGSIIDRSELIRSIIGLRGVVRAGTKIESSIIMGIDHYENPEQAAQNAQQGIPPVGIGSGCFIQNAIIDKNARIGDEVVIVNKDNVEHADAENHSIREHIVVVPKDAVIPSGTVI